ncbi:trypsin-like serine protease [Luteolibacter luteus]|uniref:S1 family peptidase n=1 Tax=Luteolibacter luteus TaxID=2728835 RepID=A0A858RP51_9BACT|nr:trypsin-like serine protease [Luteolibacter luteus]QJE99226.1 S1 family peptidase [Luteolibacter luteus]
MHRRYLSPISIAIMAVSATASASTIIAPADDPAVTAQMYRDAAQPYTSVGEVKGSGFGGSGVSIGGQWVLTAGHVALSKQNGGTFVLGGQTYTVQSAIVHPNFTLSGPNFDVGLLFLSTAVNGVPPAQMYDFGSPESILGQQATWVGYGLAGTGATGQQGPFEFRAFTNVIDVLGDHPLYEGLPSTSFIADFDRPGDPTKNNPASDPTPTLLEGNVTPGDSGGGVFVTVAGVNYLVGINSYSGTLDAMSGSTNGRYGALSGASHLSLFYPWIFEQTGIAAVPEPTAALLVAFGGMAMLSRRRREIHG